MALNSRLKSVIDKLLRTNATEKDVYKRSDISAGRDKVLAELKSILGSPANNSRASLISWGEKQSHGMLEFLNREQDVAELKQYMEQKAAELFQKEYWKNISMGAVTLFRKEIDEARVKIFNALDIYATHASSYFEVSVGRGARDVLKSSAVSVGRGPSLISSMSGQDLGNYISGALGLTAEKVANIQRKYSTGQPKVSKATRDADQKIINSFFAKFESLPDEIKSYLTVSNSQQVKTILLLWGGKLKGDRLDQREKDILAVLNKNRILLRGAKSFAKATEPKNEASKPSDYRSARDILQIIGPLLRKGDSKNVVDFAVNKIAKGDRKSLLRDVKKLNVYAGYALDMAIKVGYIPRMKKVQDGFVNSENKKILAEFVGDEGMLKKALADSTVMRKYERLGFKPDKFFKSRHGLSVVRSWKNEIVGLLNDSEKSFLNTFLKKDKERQGLPPKSSHEERFKQKKTIHESMIAHLESVRGTLEADIEDRFGKGLRERMGDKAFNTLISATISDYYDSAFKSYIQGYLYKKEELSSQRKRTNYDMRTVNLRNISTFSKTAYRLGVVTIHDLHNGIIQELRDAKNSGRTKGPRSSLIEWAFEIQNYTGVKLERNMEVIREITEFLNDNSEELGIYSNRIDEETKHLGDRQDHDHKIDGQKLSDSRARVKKIETDMDRRKDREEKKMLYNIMQQVKSGSPRIQSILRLMEPGQRKKTLIENPVLREIFRQINNINKTRGLDSTKRAVWVFEHPSAGKGGQKDLFWTRDKKGNKILPPTENEKLKGSKDSQGFGKWVKTKDASSLAAENDWMQKFFMREFRHEGNRRIKGSSEYKTAMRIAKQTMYSERYNELQGLFTRQDGKFELPRNSGLNQHLQEEAMKNVQFKENRSLNEERLDNMSEQISRGFGIARVSSGWKAEGRNTAYIEQMALGGASLATMVERAQTIEQMDEVRQYISDIIPMRHLKGVEALNGSPEYTVKNESENEPTEKVKGLGAFMDFHETRINTETQTREAAARLNEKEGLNKL